MPITINGSGTLTGISAGGLPDDSIIAADIAAGAVTTAKVADANITAAKLDGAQSGSAPIYAARAWVNFNGTGTVAIRASGNVSSITDNGTGDYTVNFTTALADANYSVNGTASGNGAHPTFAMATAWDVAPSASLLRIYTARTGGSGSGGDKIDSTYVSVAIFR